MRVQTRFPGFRLAAAPAARTPRETRTLALPAPLLRNDIGQLEKADILVVLAHPDDETFMAGTLARLKSRGYAIQLAYATSGDAGQDFTQRGLTGNTLARTREQELMSSLFYELRLDRPPVMLRYPDGQTGDHLPAIAHDIEALVRQTQPELVLTFGPDGYTGHRDHINVGHMTDQVARRLSHGRIYHTAIPDSANDVFRRAFDNDPASSWRQVHSVPDSDIRVRVNVRDALPLKIAAQMRHQTQFKLHEIENFRQYNDQHPYEAFTGDTFTRYQWTQSL